MWFGTFWGGFAVAALDVERFLGLGYGGFGLVLAAAVGCGGLANVVAGPVAERWGTSAGLSRALAAWAVLVAAAAVAEPRALFALLFVAAVTAGGVLDVMMNVAATAQLGARPGRLAQFHGLFNAGTVLGAAAMAGLLAAGASWRWAFGATALLAAALSVWIGRSELPAGGGGESHPPLAALRFLRREGLIWIAVAFVAAAVVEGGVDTWGVLFLRSQIALGVLAGAGAYVAGQSLATGSRTQLGPVAGRLPAALAAGTGALVAAAGLALEAGSPSPALAGAGLALGVVGISLCWPLLMAAGARASPRPALAVGGLTTAAYTGFLLGPAVVGWVAGGLGLRAALLMLAAAAVVPMGTVLLGRR